MCGAQLHSLPGRSRPLPSPPRAGSRVLLVSNRLPVTLVRGESGAYEPRPSSGGLATALWPLHREGEGLWLGWPGRLPESGGERRRARSGLRAARLLPVSLKPEIERDFYHGFANTTLWPLLHYRPHLARLEDRWWEAYQAANRAFARAVLRVARADDTIWLHDYHLMLVPRLLRRRLPTARIGFFLHTPFPSSEVFRILPWRRELLDGLLGADLVGFQVYDYLRHFRRTVSLVLGVENDGEPLWVGDRQVSTGVFPIGIDPDRFCDCSRSDPAAREQLESLRLELGRRRLILGVDRMDYSKGIPERLRGYERLLERHPSLHGRVELLQIGVPSREEVDDYRSLRQDVEAIVGRINGRFGTPEWTPVKYLYRPVAFPHLCALYRHAAVALVTPLRDGMNLVAKEYVAAQRGGDGVLVLSEFAGSAAELAEAVHVNPYDPGAISDAIYTALTLPRQERMERMAALVRRVWAGRVSRWAGRFLEALDRASTRQEPFPPRLTGSVRTELLAEWSAAAGRLVMLDYDGTLTEFTPRPELARPDAELLDLLRRLGGDRVRAGCRDAGAMARQPGSAARGGARALDQAPRPGVD